MSSFHKRTRRKRGVILSAIGWQRLQTAQKQSEMEDNQSQPYTLEDLNELTGLSINTLTKVRRRKTPVDKQTLEDYFGAFQLTLTPQDYARPEATKVERKSITPIRQDWGEALDVSVFYGRIEELATLETWIVAERSRLVGLLGIGGIGKTALSVRLGQQIQEQFEYVIWRSLRNAPPFETLLGELVTFLSQQQETEAKIGHLLQCLRNSRCLLILDNLETILQPREQAGEYRPSYEEYGELLRLVGETSHQSCLVITSREKPAELATFESIDLAVRSLHLSGSPEASLALIQASRLVGSEEQQQQLGVRYGYNPLALKIVATSIRELFDGEIEEFLAQDIAVFNGIQKLLKQQFERLSSLEQTIMYWLAINREWTTISELAADIVPTVSKSKLLEALESLCWRSLIEKQLGSYTQQTVVMEYVIESLTEQIATELIENRISVFANHALLKTTVKDYVRAIQARLILKPLLDKLNAIFGHPKEIKNCLVQILSIYRGRLPSETGYIGGNILNLLRQLQVDIYNYNFSHLTIWQAYLQGVNLHEVNFAYSHIAKSIFTQTFGSILSVALSPDSLLFATGDSKGEIRLCRVADGQQLSTFKGHNNWVLSITFSPNGRLLASGSGDFSIGLWDIQSGRCHRSFNGHSNWVRSIAFSPDGELLASGSEDSSVRLWDVKSGKCCLTFEVYGIRILSVAFSPDSRLIASGNGDSSVKLWDVKSRKCCLTLAGHSGTVRSVAFSPNGRLLASGSEDSSVRLWDVKSGKCCLTLAGHSRSVRSVVFSPNGRLLASGSEDSSVRLWDVKSGKCCLTLAEHSSRIWSVAFSPNGRLLASGSEDSSVRLWDVKSGRCFHAFEGYSNGVLSVAFSPRTKVFKSSERQLLVSGSEDSTVRLWDISSGKCCHTFQGHTDRVLSVAFSPDGQMLASSSEDSTVRLWDIPSGKCRHTFEEHTIWLRSVVFSPDSETLVSTSNNYSIRLWDIASGKCCHTLKGHTDWVLSVAFSPNGKTLVSGSADRMLRLWDIASGKCYYTLKGHSSRVRSVAFSPDGNLFVSGSEDYSVRLWDATSGKCCHTFEGHTNWVRSVAFSFDGKIIVSGSGDGTIKLWYTETGRLWKTLRTTRPYEGMNITGVTGLSEAQKATLKVLGAVEH